MTHTASTRRAFTLIELLVVIGILALIISVLLPTLSTAKRRAMQHKMAGEPQPAAAVAAGNRDVERPASAPAARPLARVKAFEAAVSLKPSLSVGTAQPESIYEAKLTAKLQAARGGAAGRGGDEAREVEIHLPLPPQIISLADLSVTVGGQPSESVALRGDKLVWYGPLPPGDEATDVAVTYSAFGKGLYTLEVPPGGILETFKIDLTATGSDVRMLELSLQPTRQERGSDRTVYTWDYKRLLYGRPIALDVLGIAPIDRLGELTWLGPASVVVFGLFMGLVLAAYDVTRFDRWMLLLILGTFTGAYPLIYFAQDFVPLSVAILASAGLVLALIAIRVVTIMPVRLAIFGVVLPAGVIMTVTLLAATRTNLQGILITGVFIALFIAAMLLIPRLRVNLASAEASAEAVHPDQPMKEDSGR